MNSYKIIFPYQSDRTHLAHDEFNAFDKCYEEIRESGKNPKIFVVLNVNTNTPYYLEMNAPNPIPNPSPIEEYVINKDTRDEVSDVLSIDPTGPVAPFQGDPVNVDQREAFANPMRSRSIMGQHLDDSQNVLPMGHVPSTGEIQGLQRRVENAEQRADLMERKINIIEGELIRTKMKVDYISQLSVGQTNMNNLLNRPAQKVEPEVEEGCIIM
jgi:hypothetical protein